MEHLEPFIFQTSFVKPFTQRFAMWDSLHMERKLKPWDRNHQSGRDPINTSPEEERKGFYKRVLAGEDNSLLNSFNVTVPAVCINKLTYQ